MKKHDGLDNLLKRANKARSLKRCLHPSAPVGCGSNIIKAHSVSRSSALAAISDNGHVYGQKPHIIELEKHAGQIQIHKIGIGEASTFTGFCDIHDASLFLPIETRPFAFESIQIALYAYRAICRELYNKLCVPSFHSIMMETAAQKEHPLDQKAIENYADNFLQGSELGVQDLEEYRELYGEMLLSGDFSQLGFIAAEFDGPMLLACSGAHSPELNLKNYRIQTLDNPLDLPDNLTLSFVPTSGGGYIIITYLKNHTQRMKSLINQIRSLQDCDLYETMTSYAISCFENFYLSPKVYDSLSPSMQAIIKSKMMQGIYSNFDFGVVLNLPPCKLVKRVQN